MNISTFGTVSVLMGAINWDLIADSSLIIVASHELYNWIWFQAHSPGFDTQGFKVFIDLGVDIHDGLPQRFARDSILRKNSSHPNDSAFTSFSIVFH